MHAGKPLIPKTEIIVVRDAEIASSILAGGFLLLSEKDILFAASSWLVGHHFFLLVLRYLEKG